jgi:uncharacterized protein
MTDQLREQRMALISVLAEQSPKGTIGRTGVMKLLYFLQVLRDVPLDYRFTLYSYGPFDSDVLSDLADSEALGVVATTIRQFSGGYGYEITPGPNANWLQDRAVAFLRQHEKDIEWVVGNFGGLNSGQLELVSTIVYVDREAAENDQRPSLDDISEIVHEIKPHFSMDKIMEFAVWLSNSQLIRAAA